MAVSNAVGSNIFDITVGLGFPWMLILLFQGGTISVGVDGIWTSTLVLLGTILVLFVFVSTDRELTKKEGYALLALYAAYVIWIWTSA